MCYILSELDQGFLKNIKLLAFSPKSSLLCA